MKQENGQLIEAINLSTVHLQERSRGLTGDEPIILDVQNLKKSFYSRKGLWGRDEFQAVKGVSFKLAKGKTLGLVGESGSGKTTIGLLLMRLHEATGGQAFIDGKDILAMSEKEFALYQRKIQIIFQNPYASLNPRFTIGQILLEPMRIHGIGQNDQERKKIALELLERVSLPVEAYDRYPHEFSGGQRQRIAIARCLTLKPEILICDESVSALDVSVQAQVLNLLQDLQDEFSGGQRQRIAIARCLTLKPEILICDESVSALDVSVQAQVLNLLQDLQDEFGLSYIFISHDLSVVKYISDQVMVMNHGEVVEIANSDELYLNPQHEYTQKLLKAIPQGIA
jgi:peptide/nickel transport system ATP-binding protein